MKFRFIDSSKTGYAIPKQLERQLVSMGLESSDDSEAVTICYATDYGIKNPDHPEIETTPENYPSLNKYIDSKADLLFYVQEVGEKWFDRPNAYFLPHGVNTDIFYNKKIKRTTDVGFAGKFYKRKNRIEFIKKLRGQTEFNFAMSEKPIYFEELSNFYNCCKIVVNDSQMDELTMRMFEATACGALLLTRDIECLDTIFKKSGEMQEIVTYTDNDDMIRKINYYLNNEQIREQIAENGNICTITKYALNIHAKFIEQKIKDFLNGKQSTQNATGSDSENSGTNN